MGTFYVVAKREESIASQSYTGITGNPFAFLFTGKRSRTLCEELLPDALGEYVFIVIADINVDGIVAIGTSDILHPWQLKHAGMLSEPPIVGFVAGKTCAMNAALLAGTDANGLPVFHVTYRIALCVFKDDECNDEVSACIGWDVLALGGNVGKQRSIIQPYLISALFKCNAKYLLAFNGVRTIGSCLSASRVISLKPRVYSPER